MNLYYCSNYKVNLDLGISARVYSFKEECINDAIYSLKRTKFYRDHCVFLDFYKDYNCKYLYKINGDNLLNSSLFVADKNIANKIYKIYLTNQEYCIYLSFLIEKYIKSIVPFNEYNENYENPEILYFCDIEAELIEAITL